jgi:hypothetical protein
LPIGLIGLGAWCDFYRLGLANKRTDQFAYEQC